MIEPGSTLGIVGGGQLGKMMIMAASRMGYQTVVFSDKEDSPACHVTSRYHIAPYDDFKALSRFANLCDVITFEFENIPHRAVQFLEEKALVRPGFEPLYMSQNRVREKEFVNGLNIPTARYKAVNDIHSLQEAVAEIGTPCVLKTVEMGYDGKGQHFIEDPSHCPKDWNLAGILEEWIPFEKEISVVAARNPQGDVEAFAPVQNIHQKGILVETRAPADISLDIAELAKKMTKQMMEALNYVGVFAVEFFLTHDHTLLVNECAPRPHNSGHWTIDACNTGQFEQHIRAVCGLPLGDPSWHTKAVMTNLIGLEAASWEHYFNDSRAKIHLYGKRECLAGRKMGHVTTLKGG